MKALILVGFLVLTFVLSSRISSNGAVLEEESSLDWRQVSLASGLDGAILASEGRVSEPGVTENLSAAAFGVYNFDGEVILSGNESKKWPIASIAKLMTALVSAEMIPRDKKIEVREEYIAITEGVAGGFSVGEIFLPRDLDKSILIVSSNVGAETLAGHYGRERFIDTMNSFASRLGMRDTRFEDPTGISYKNQSTVADLEKLTRYINREHPEILTLSRKASDKVYDYKSGRRRSIVSINQLAGKKDFWGGKTGTTPEAVGNLVSMFSKDGGKTGRVVILLGTENRFEETEMMIREWR